MGVQTSWSRQSSFKSRMIFVSWGFCNPSPWSPWRKILRYGDPSGVWPRRLDSAIWRTEGFLSRRNGINYYDRQFRFVPRMFYETRLLKLVFHDLPESQYLPTSVKHPCCLRNLLGSVTAWSLWKLINASIRCSASGPALLTFKVYRCAVFSTGELEAVVLCSAQLSRRQRLGRRHDGLQYHALRRRATRHVRVRSTIFLHPPPSGTLDAQQWPKVSIQQPCRGKPRLTRSLFATQHS